MKRSAIISLLCVLALGGFAAWLLIERSHPHSDDKHGHSHDSHDGHDDHAEESPRGPHNGRLFSDGAFTVELAIFEAGIPPEFRAWFTLDGQLLQPDKVALTVKLTRANGVVDEHTFSPAGDFARSPAEVYEPHSFHYTVIAGHNNRTHRWELDAPEMQTVIAAEAAERAGVKVAIAGPAKLAEILPVYGQVRVNTERVSRATARFAGLVQETRKSIGDRVSAGEVLAIVEANASLTRFEVPAPRSGMIIARDATVGETVPESTALYTIADLSEVWIDLNIPRGDQTRVELGQAVAIHAEGMATEHGVIAWLSPFGAVETQTLIARVVVSNPDTHWRPGLFVQADIKVGTHDAAVAVHESALQTLFDFNVVFSQHGELYQARPLELGRRSDGYVEVLKGLNAGETYVSENSFLIKADIGKSAASHDH